MKKISLLLPCLLVGLWQLACSLRPGAYDLVASPAGVLAGLADLCLTGMPPGRLLPGHILYSLSRIFFGFSLAAACGVPLGILSGGNPKARALVMPLIDFFRPIPPLAWIPMAIIWFGIGFRSAVFIIFLGAFFPIALNTCIGVATVDRGYLDVARTFNAGRLDIWRKVLIPGAVPSIFTGLRLGLGIGWMTLVAAEFTGVRQGYGLGYMIMTARDLQRIDEVMAGMAVIGLIGLAIEWGMTKLAGHILGGRRVGQWIRI
jgi:ABC-type nitrate/sulfonate/bicarbonate transport system permease component